MHVAQILLKFDNNLKINIILYIMKKTFYLLAAAFAAFCCASCTAGNHSGVRGAPDKPADSDARRNSPA